VHRLEIFYFIFFASAAFESMPNQVNELEAGEPVISDLMVCTNVFKATVLMDFNSCVDLPGLPPGYAQPPTLVLDFEDTLVHAVWDPKFGWRYAKRPGKGVWGLRGEGGVRRSVIDVMITGD
jgi:hypothetical protein